VEDILKSRLVLILILLNVIFLITSIGSCNYSYQMKKSRDSERETRFSSQENLERLSREKSSLEENLKKTMDELANEKAALETANRDLGQEQLINKSLKSELEKLNKLKQALEEDLKEALVTGKVQMQKSK
jgi:predicted RNase H-like nuclease (RuvC/YqgF family)